MQKVKANKHKDFNGIERFWVWTHIVPRVLSGLKREKQKRWYAFKTEIDANVFVEMVDSYARTSGEVGIGIPPQHIVDSWEYEERFEPWE